jgi:hypothetical protein
LRSKQNRFPARPQRVLNSFQQRTLLIVLERDLTQAVIFFGMTRPQQCREQNGFLLLLMVIVSKSLEKLQYAIHIAIIHIFAICHTIGHFADDLKSPKDVSMLVHQNTCRFHGGLLSLLQLVQVAFPHSIL